MNIFVLVLPGRTEATELPVDRERIPKSERLSATTWLLGSRLGTSAEVGEALGLNGDADSAETWVVIKMEENGYFGYAVASLWQKLADWEKTE